MMGREYKSEKKAYGDVKTGREIWQLTGGESNNIHLYFTDNSFTLEDREIYFVSDRSSGRPDVFNYFKMDLETGIMTQITDEKNGIGSHTKTPESDILLYTVGNTVKKTDTRTGRTEVIYEESEAFRLGAPFISPDKKYVGITKNERIHLPRIGPNYSGFTETMYAIKKGWITLIAMDGSYAEDIYEDTHWLGHFQFSPDDGNIATFCHEGPWNLVHQRIWIMDFDKRSAIPCFRQGADDCVGHEFWTRDGLIFFDNRRKGHDGTITSDKSQATVQETHTEQVPYIGFCDKGGKVLKTIDMPYYCNHYHANNDNSQLVGDAVEDLVRIDIKGEKAKLDTLCNHSTSWYTGRTHCHPTFSWKGDQILYLSDRDGKCNLYLIPNV